MLILFDHGTPRSIARWLHGHTVVEAMARGWDKLANGALLNAAEEAGFDLLLSTDKNIQYQQSLKGRRIAIVILGNSQRPAVHRDMDRVVAAVNAATPGSFAVVESSGGFYRQTPPRLANPIAPELVISSDQEGRDAWLHDPRCCSSV